MVRRRKNCDRKSMEETILRRPGVSLGAQGYRPACQCRVHGFNPWAGKTQHALEQVSPGPQPLRLCSQQEAAAARSLHTATESSPGAPRLEGGPQQRRAGTAGSNKRREGQSSTILTSEVKS